jgi:hypothetical protein
MAILAISHVIKSITYKHQYHRFRLFRQSLQISKLKKGRVIRPRLNLKLWYYSAQESNIRDFPVEIASANGFTG